MTNIKLNIKSPTSDEDKCLSTSLESTVKDVKCQIEKEWDSHPSPKDQRLVYAGKMLENNSVLREVLRLEDARDENDAFTIHLICRNSIQTPKSPAAPNSAIKTGQNSDQNSNLRRRNNVETSSPNNSSALPSTAGTNNGQTWNSTPTTADQQAILMQQVYANYMTQYVQYLQSIGYVNGAYPGVTWPNQAVGQTLVEHTNQIADEARAGGAAVPPAGPQPQVFDHVHAAAAVAGVAAANHNLQQQPPAVQPQPQVNQHNVQNDVIANQVPVENNNMGPDGPNVVMNAGAGGIGAMEDEDDLNGGQRDVLDWCYVVTRVLVLFSVVYFYSSLARFALAAGLGIIFYLYNNGFFGQPQRRPQDQDQNQQNHEAAVNEVRQVAGAAGDRGDAEGQPAAGEGQVADGEGQAAAEVGGTSEAARAAEDIPQPQIHPLNVLSTFVTTFFTSLLPNDPQVV